MFGERVLEEMNLPGSVFFKEFLFVAKVMIIP
jgi:hypothetical protein